MICTCVMLCLSTDLAKNDKIMSMFVPFFRLFLAILTVWHFFQNGGTSHTPKQSNMIF